jgi:aerobic-type carbon monoxide dehydrogenase small subunit (CoxS/CutS family)
MSRSAAVSVVINGVAYERNVPARRLLTDFLRSDLSLTGTHVGCEHGVCGACNVFVDGELVRACLTLAVQVHGKSVTTIEGVSSPGELHPAQRALFDHHGLQCGFCTPGVVMSLIDLVERGVESETAIREELSGNLCRCTGYAGILAAARELVQGRGDQYNHGSVTQ